MTTLKSSEGTEDDYIFRICPNTNNSCAYIKLKANSLAKFAQRIELYDDIPDAQLDDEAYYLTRLDNDNRENRLNISLPNSNGIVRLTLSSAFFGKIARAGGKIEPEENKRIIHNGKPSEPNRITNMFAQAQGHVAQNDVGSPPLTGICFMNYKDNPFLSHLMSMAIFLPAADANFAMAVQVLSEKRIPYEMDYQGVVISEFEAILDVIALGGKFVGSDDIMAMAKDLLLVA